MWLHCALSVHMYVPNALAHLTAIKKQRMLSVYLIIKLLINICIRR